MPAPNHVTVAQSELVSQIATPMHGAADGASVAVTASSNTPLTINAGRADPSRQISKARLGSKSTRDLSCAGCVAQRSASAFRLASGAASALLAALSRCGRRDAGSPASEFCGAGDPSRATDLRAPAFAKSEVFAADDDDDGRAGDPPSRASSPQSGRRASSRRTSRGSGATRAPCASGSPTRPTRRTRRSAHRPRTDAGLAVLAAARRGFGAGSPRSPRPWRSAGADLKPPTARAEVPRIGSGAVVMCRV